MKTGHSSEKRCFKCGATKPMSEFYRHRHMGDGHLNKCKLCTKADVADRYSKKREQVREYEVARARDPTRRENQKRYHREAKARNKLHFQARYAVANAIRGGKLTPLPCEVCGSRFVQGHHDDYEKPLDVRWLCFRHHREEHGHKEIAPEERIPKHILHECGVNDSKKDTG